MEDNANPIQGTQPQGEEGKTPTLEELQAKLAETQQEAEEAKKKFKDSSKGAMELIEKNKQLKARLEAMELQNVNDDELAKYYPDYDEMTDTERRHAKEVVSLKKEIAERKRFEENYKKDRYFEKAFSDPAISQNLFS